jgi:hypothetical protein
MFFVPSCLSAAMLWQAGRAGTPFYSRYSLFFKEHMIICSSRRGSDFFLDEKVSKKSLAYFSFHVFYHKT